MKLEGTIAIVTGGANGIGKAITGALLQRKVKVIKRVMKIYYGQCYLVLLRFKVKTDQVSYFKVHMT